MNTQSTAKFGAAQPRYSTAYIVRKSIQLKAAPADVWDALTNPEKTKKYFFRCEVHSDWIPGHSIKFKGKIFFVWPIELSGEIVRVEPQRLLKYTLTNNSKNGKPASTSTVTDTLSYDNGITTLSITDDVGNGEGAEERYERSIKGWDKILQGLKNLLEK